MLFVFAFCGVKEIHVDSLSYYCILCTLKEITKYKKSTDCANLNSYSPSLSCGCQINRVAGYLFKWLTSRNSWN